MVESLSAIWPGSTHVSQEGLSHATDRELWEWSKIRGFSIVSKDSDFLNLALLHGAPPKIILIRGGNSSTQTILHCLLAQQPVIQRFAADAQESVLVIS